jgi:Family of unknown function (DUF5681)
MADEENDYKVGPGRPPLHTRFRKGQSGNPGGRSQKKLHALLADALNEQVFVTVGGERRKITKREAVVHQLVNKSATADLRATKDQGGRAEGQRHLADASVRGAPLPAGCPSLALSPKADAVGGRDEIDNHVSSVPAALRGDHRGFRFGFADMASGSCGPRPPQ